MAISLLAGALLFGLPVCAENVSQPPRVKADDYCNGATDNETTANSVDQAYHGWYWNWENDAAGVIKSDDQYTQGAQFGYTFKNTSGVDVSSWFCRLLGFNKPGEEAGSKVIGARSVFMGQQLFTPKNTDAVEPIPDDRPYAGWAYIGTRLELVQAMEPSKRGHRRWRTQSFELQVGDVGPGALGEQTQNKFHHDIKNAVSNGWQNQISDRFGWMAVYNVSQRVYSFEVGRCCDGFTGDFLLQSGAAIGNLQKYVEASAIFRIGRNMGPMPQRAIMPTDFEATLKPLDAKPNLDTAECNLLFGAKECYVFVGAAARGVDGNIFLEPAASGAGAIIKPDPIVYDLTFGGRLRYSWARFDYVSTTRSREFSPGPANPLQRSARHDFGSLTMSCYGEFGDYHGSLSFICPTFVALVTGFLVFRSE